MKYYAISLKLQIGEYEKNSNKVVMANNISEAEKMALIGECHNSADFEGRLCWDGGEMVYSVRGCKEITEDQYNWFEKTF